MLLLAEPARSQLYRWQDADGVWHFSDRPRHGLQAAPRSAAPATLALGMSAKEVRAAKGNPDYIFRSRQGNRQRWLYGSDFVFLVDDRVTALRPALGPSQREPRSVHRGMSYSALIETWGPPDAEETQLSQGRIELQLRFGAERLTVRDGVVVRVEGRSSALR